MSQVETTSAGVLPSRAPSWMNKSHCKRHKSKGKTNTEQIDSLHFAVKSPLLDTTPKGSGLLIAFFCCFVYTNTHTTRMHAGFFCSFSEEWVKNFERKAQIHKTLRQNSKNVVGLTRNY